MSNFWKYFLFLCWISYLLVCGVLLFSQGFFLRRQVQSETSRCVSNLYCSQPHLSKKSSDPFEECKALPHPLTHLLMAEDICTRGRSKVVLIIIDALRYDFVAQSNSTNLKPFENRLTTIHEALEKKPGNARLFKFIADPPTTTMQRLKALTTGSLPTFIDVSSNFASKDIDEDNIIDQLHSQNKSVIFMGDDTWTSLYPGRFKRQYPYPSFNVWDLDTVDTGVRKHLVPEIQKKDWSLLVSHFLGVDHCGHRYGPYHPEMSRKLDEMNEVLRETMSAIEDDTMLIVLGDHGMTSTGDHGGGSEAEVTAALFMYYPSGFLFSKQITEGNIVNQIDLVPTLAAALGIPIPFSNIGTIILDGLPKISDRSSSLNILLDWQFALLGLWSNVRQTMTYIQTYAQQNRAFSKNNLELLNKLFVSFSTNVTDVTNEREFLSVIVEGKLFLSSTLQMCQKVWVQFDTFSLTWGLVFTIVILMVLFLVIETLPADTLAFAVSKTYLSLAYIGLLVSATVSYFLSIIGSISNFDHVFFVSTFGVSFVFLAAICADNASAIFAKLSSIAHYKTWTDVLCRIVCTLTLWAVTSNSYVEAEASVLSFFLLSLCVLLVYSYRPSDEVVSGSCKQKFDKSTFGWLKSQIHPLQAKVISLAIAFGMAVRITHSYWRCRDEQSGCSLSYHHFGDLKKKVTISADPHSLAMLVCTALWVTVTRMWLRSCGNLTGYSYTVLLSRYVPTVIAVCSSCFWVLQGLPGDTRNKLFKPWQLQILPLTVYSLAGLGFIGLAFQPLCVFVVNRRQTSSFSVQVNKNPIPQLYNQMKKLMSGYKDGSADDGHSLNNRPMVYGLATAYSAAFSVVAVLVVLVLGLLLGSHLSQAVITVACAAVALLFLLSVLRYQNILVSVQLLSTSWSSVLCWSLLAQYAFYGTGHQATFSSIQWDAAMVGTNGNIGGNKFIPAALVIANTFGSHILMGLLLPLILIAPLTLHMMLPRWTAVSVDDQELAQGELMLFHREELMYRSLATLSSRYIFLQASRSLACMIAATIHARHLMAWAVFAPKFIFEAFAMFVTLPCVLLSFLLMGRVTSCVHTLLRTVDSNVSKIDCSEKKG